MSIVYGTQTTNYASDAVSEQTYYENYLRTADEEDSLVLATLGQHRITKNVSFHKKLVKVYFIPHKSDTSIYCFHQQPLNVKTVHFRPYTDIYVISMSHIEQKLEVKERCTTECLAKLEKSLVDDLPFSSSPSLKSSEVDDLPFSSSPSLKSSEVDDLPFSSLPSLKSSELPISPSNHVNITKQSHQITTISPFAILPEFTRKIKTTKKGKSYALRNYRKAASVIQETSSLPSLGGGNDKNK